MAKTRQQKEDLVKKLVDKLKRAKSVVFADYKGLSMNQLSGLRDKLREQQAEFTVTKNTLLKLALPISDIRYPTSEFEGPTATLFSYDDEISPIKILVKTLKDAGKGSVKFGFFGPPAGGDVLDEARLIQLSTLPTKIELAGLTVGVLVAPLKGMVSVLQGNLKNLIFALDQIKIAKGGV